MGEGKMIIYQTLPRLWGNVGSGNITGGSLAENGSGRFSSFDKASLDYLREDLGVTHVWYTGIIRHATTESFEGCPASNPMIVKGKAGSPYAIVDYYDVNPYLADNPSDRMGEFESLIRRTHEAGMKVIIDFVPNHVSRDYGKAGVSLTPPDGVLGSLDDTSVHWSPDNDFYYYPGEGLRLPVSPMSVDARMPYHEYPAKASGNRFSPAPGINDWYETIRLNHCDFHTKTWDRMLDIVLFWRGKGVDGFRCDMLEMVPWEFMKWLIASVKERFPETTFIGEVYEKDKYRLYIDEVGFDYLYDKSGLYDTFVSIIKGHGTARGITWNWQSLGDLQPRMLNFLENHDEVRFASRFLAGDPRCAGAFLCASLLFNTSPFMIYSGEELGECGEDTEGFSGFDGRTTIFDWWSPATLRTLYQRLHSGDKLPADLESVLDIFKEALAMARKPLIAKGLTYDLCYCNQGSTGFDPDRHFTFARALDGEGLIVVCNLSGEDADIVLKVPAEAVAYMGLNKTEAFEVNVSVKAFGYSVLPV